MDNQFRGVTIALALVSLAAIGVSFVAAAQARRKANQVAALRGEVRRISQTHKALEAELKEVAQRTDREREAAQELKEALAQEQLRNRTLAEQLEERQAPDSTSHPEAKQAKSNITAR